MSCTEPCGHRRGTSTRRTHAPTTCVQFRSPVSPRKRSPASISAKTRSGSCSPSSARCGALWESLSFPAAGWRYHLSNAPFAYADGAILAAMLLHLRPRRYVEVGSGWSTCLALDLRDRCPGVLDSITVIDPYPDPRVRTESCVLIEQRLQDLPASAFDDLTSGDVLFVDSTHVAKAGSDVNRLVFEVLPRLHPGVFVHIHDVHWPFEYPRDWLLGGRAWQESYVLRAFLEFNDSYEISLWGSFMFFKDREYLGEHLPVALVSQGGGSIWLRRREMSDAR